MRACLLAAVLMVCVLLGCPWDSQGAQAQASELISSVELPLQTSLQLATTALERCEQRGAAVSVSVVDRHGGLQVYLRSDQAAPHTADLSRQKAYTAASLAAAQGFHTTGELAKAMAKSPMPVGQLGLPAAAVPGITPVPGGLALRWQNQLLGGIGVSGASQGDIDEVCALAAEQRWLADLDAALGATGPASQPR